ncbi:MAG: helix-turn-helix transcriptional regulator [Nitrospirae bacterium]|nr:helix-turn-helix transcriptional regulator [Nitrospirota bacterium]
MKKVTYEEHIKELLKKKAVREEFEKLLPEYELVKSIIEQRLRKKMTQEDIAKKADIPQSTVSRIERLTHGLPKLSTLKKIANALDAKLVIKLETKNTLNQYTLGTNYEKPLTIKEARKHYGKKPVHKI